MDREQVAESIRTLYRTGDYADLRAMSTPVDGGCASTSCTGQLVFQSGDHHGFGVSATEASAIARCSLRLGSRSKRYGERGIGAVAGAAAGRGIL